MAPTHRSRPGNGAYLSLPHRTDSISLICIDGIFVKRNILSSVHPRDLLVGALTISVRQRFGLHQRIGHDDAMFHIHRYRTFFLIIHYTYSVHREMQYLIVSSSSRHFCWCSDYQCTTKIRTTSNYRSRRCSVVYLSLSHGFFLNHTLYL